jgi:hypothetical protein
MEKLGKFRGWLLSLGKGRRSRLEMMQISSQSRRNLIKRKTLFMNLWGG